MTAQRSPGFLQQLEDLLGQAVSLSLPLMQATPYGPFSGATVETYGTSGSQPRQSTTFTTNIHELTHVDLPWTIPLDTWREYLREARQDEHTIFRSLEIPTADHVQQMQDFWIRPHVFRALIVDATSRPAILIDALETPADGLSMPSSRGGTTSDAPVLSRQWALDIRDPYERLPLNLGASDYLKLMLALRITAEEIRPAIEAFAQEHNPARSLILFKT